MEFQAKDNFYLDVYNRDQLTITTPSGAPLEINHLSKQAATEIINIYIDWSITNTPATLSFIARNITNAQTRLYIREDYYGPDGFPSSYSPPKTLQLHLRADF